MKTIDKPNKRRNDHDDLLINTLITLGCINEANENNKEVLDRTVKSYFKTTESSLTGDSAGIETILLGHIFTLDAIFHRMTAKAMLTNSSKVSQIQMEIALKAQKQCRQTASAFIDIKQPKSPIFVKQQNNAINQQVNNNQAENSKKKSENELLKDNNNERLDEGRTFKTSLSDQELETLGEIHRAKN